jgi:hypothetical protein
MFFNRRSPEMKSKYFVLSLLALFVGPSIHAASPAGTGEGAQVYYLVFQLDDSREPQLVFQRQVQMASLPASDSPEQVLRAQEKGRSERELITARVIAENGEQVFQKVIDLDQHIRAEFAGPDGVTMKRHEVKEIAPAFVLRLPAFPDGTLWLDGRSATGFSISEIANETAKFQAPEQDGPTVNGPAGPPSNRFDFLVMGDGYTASQSAMFDNHVADFTNNFFGISPYQEYQSFVNTTGMFVASPESGADHPPYDAACDWRDRGCCADTIAQTDPLAGTFVDTAFDATFCLSNAHRLIGVNTAKVYAAAAASPDWDHIIVLVNDTTYGGAGGAIAVTSNHPSGIAVVQHEVGHSFTDLADEYDSAFPSYPACSDLPGDVGVLPACEANATNETTRAAIKWVPWIDINTPIPTPENSGWQNDVGLFEGARYLATGMYRPKDGCMMKALASNFCEVCEQAYVLRLYEGGWGPGTSPVDGIDLIEPGSESPAPGAFESTAPVDFSIGVLQLPTGVSFAWKVDGTLLPGETTNTFRFNPGSDGVYLIEVEASDPTAKVHPDMTPEGALSSTRSWTVTIGGPIIDYIFDDGFESPIF